MAELLDELRNTQKAIEEVTRTLTDLEQRLIEAFRRFRARATQSQ